MNNSTYGDTGLPVISSEITIEGHGATIQRDSVAPDFRILHVRGNLTLKETTISGGVGQDGCIGGGGGGLFNGIYGITTIISSTITGNMAGVNGGGVSHDQFRDDALTLNGSLVSGNAAVAGPGISTADDVIADNHNLFGFDNDARVEGFTPGPTDIVPAPGVLLGDILDPLADNGALNTVWYYRNMPAVAPKLEPPGKHDACYLPRRIHVTGAIDIHELAWSSTEELWLVNTRFYEGGVQ